MSFYGSYRYLPHYSNPKREIAPRVINAPVPGITDYDALYKARNKHPGPRYTFLVNCLKEETYVYREERSGHYIVDLAFDIYGKELPGYSAVFVSNR